MDWAIEKATELGVAAVGSRDCAPDGEASGRSRGEARRAMAPHCARRCQQARRSDVPLIYTPAPLAERVRAASRGHAPLCRVYIHRPRRAGAHHHPASGAPMKPSQARSGDAHAGRLRSVPKADGLPKRKPSLTPTAGAAASLGPRILRGKLPPSPRSRWSVVPGVDGEDFTGLKSDLGHPRPSLSCPE